MDITAKIDIAEMEEDKFKDLLAEISNKKDRNEVVKFFFGCMGKSELNQALKDLSHSISSESRYSW